MLSIIRIRILEDDIKEEKEEKEEEDEEEKKSSLDMAKYMYFHRNRL